MTSPLRAARLLWLRLRFRLWATRLAIQLRRRGGRLRLHAPHSAWMEKPPRLRVTAEGDGDGVLDVEIGRNVRIHAGAVLDVWARGTNRLAIGDGCVIRDGLRIELRGGEIELGDRVEIRTLVMLKSYGRLTLGEQATLGRGVYVQCEEEIMIAHHAGLAEWVSVIDSDHRPDGSDVHFLKQPVRIAPIRIGPNVFVARSSAVLRGAELGKNSLVAANSVVRRGTYPPAHLIAGSPAAAVKPLSEER
jgi:acetyltransferase-like isoleucine patch superfamily enzyme